MRRWLFEFYDWFITIAQGRMPLSDVAAKHPTSAHTNTSSSRQKAIEIAQHRRRRTPDEVVTTRSADTLFGRFEDAPRGYGIAKKRRSPPS